MIILSNAKSTDTIKAYGNNTCLWNGEPAVIIVYINVPNIKQPNALKRTRATTTENMFLSSSFLMIISDKNLYQSYERKVV